jgi:hypothetical protein
MLSGAVTMSRMPTAMAAHMSMPIQNSHTASLTQDRIESGGMVSGRMAPGRPLQAGRTGLAIG